MTRSIADIEEELETLEQDQKHLRKEKKCLVDHMHSDPSALQKVNRIHDHMHRLLILQQTKLEEIKVLRESEGETGRFSSKRKRLSLPPPTCGSAWTFNTLHEYSISSLYVEELDEFLFQARPSKSGRAIEFEDACSAISYESLGDDVYPSSSNAQWLAKHLHAIISDAFGNYGAVVDDMVIALFHGLGFNDGNLLTISQSKLRFRMSNSETFAEADVAVFDKQKMIHLAVVKDKQFVSNVEENDAKAQLVAKAIAGSMRNRQKFAERVSGCNPVFKLSNSDLCALPKDVKNPMDIPFFMVRLYGSSVTFYSHRFDDALLDCVAGDGRPTTHTRIQQYVPIIGDLQMRSLCLLSANHRKIIFETLDAIKQIIST